MTGNIFKHIVKKVQGFTLIETLIAVLLLATAVTGPLTIASKGLTAAVVARDQMIAFYLAQDGVEYVRYVRDSNKLAGSPWLNGLSACISADGSAKCYIDPSTATVTTCTSGVCPVIKKHTNGASVYFTYDSADTPAPQQFVRTITLVSAAAPNAAIETILTVSVSWRTPANITRTIVVRENLLDWQ